MTTTTQRYLTARAPGLAKLGALITTTVKNVDIFDEFLKVLKLEVALDSVLSRYMGKVSNSTADKLSNISALRHEVLSSGSEFLRERAQRTAQIRAEIKNQGGVCRQSEAAAEGIKSQLREARAQGRDAFFVGPLVDGLSRELRVIDEARAQIRTLEKQLADLEADTAALSELHSEVEAARAQYFSKASAPAEDPAEASRKRKAATRVQFDPMALLDAWGKRQALIDGSVGGE